MSMVARVEAGKTPSKDAFVDEGIPYFKMYNLRNQAIDFAFHPQFIKPEIHYGQLGKSQIHPGDLIMNIVGPPLGKLAIVPNSFPEANTNQAAVVIHSYSPEVPIAWIFYYLSEMSEINNVSTRGSAGQVNISVNQSREMFVAIPPLAEQRRIVGALGKYLALVDGIERDQADLDGLLAQLKSKVLDLAVRGELTERDPGDEPASELLARIREEKLAMVERGELKPKDVKNDTVIFTGSDGLRYEKRADGKGEAKCIEKEIPFEVPEGWSWSRMERLIQLTSGIDLAKADYNSEHNGIPYITGASNFENGSLIENRWTDKPKRISHRGDLLFTCKGTVGKMAINKFASAHIARQVMAINPYRGVDKLYLQQVLAWHVETIRRKAKGFIPGIERGVLLKALVPVPPLAEQRRIVRAIEAVISATSL